MAQGYKLGLRPDPVEVLRAVVPMREVMPFDPEILPSKVDLSHLATPVKDQGNLGSCVAFAIAAVLETFWTSMIVKDLSEAWIYWKAKEIDYWPGQEGTSFYHGLEVIKRHGVPPEATWPYKDSCKEGHMPPTPPYPWANMLAPLRKLTRAPLLLEDAIEIKGWLAMCGPALIGIQVISSMLKPESCIVHLPPQGEKPLGGHALAAFGYNETGILIKNSWGRLWGKDGWATLSWDYVSRYMEIGWGILH